MALFPVQTLTKNQVKLRWEERYTSEGLNQKFLGIPNGVYLGFIPSSTAGSDVLDLAIDPTQGVSVIRVKSSLGPYVVDLLADELIQIDFAGHVGFPVYVYAKADYRVNMETTAEIRTRLTPPNGIDEIGICKINNLGITPDIEFAAAPDRHAPIANTGIPFGFMTDGAEQDRVRAVATSDEVDAARTDELAVLHATLAARLTADFSTSQLGGRLSRVITSLRSNDRTSVIGPSINLSHSFSFKSRTQNPVVDLAGGGSESRPGAIAEVTASPDAATLAASDTDRNIVAINDVTTGRPYVDPSTGRPVFGRLKFDEVAAGVTLNWTNGNDTVVAVSDPTGVVNIGDIIIDPDGNYYPVSQTPGDVTVGSIKLATAWVQLGTTTSNTVLRRRFTVEFFTRDEAGAENVFNVVRVVTVDGGTWSSAVGSLGVAAPDTPEPYELNDVPTVAVGNIVSQAYAATDTVLYVPTDPEDVITAGEVILGQTNSHSVTAVVTQPAPNLRFYIPTFQQVNEDRSNQIHIARKIPQIIIPRATEVIDGLTRYAPHGGVSRFTGLQASDPRIPTQDQNDALAGSGGTPSAANPYVTQLDGDFAKAVAVSRSQAWMRFVSSGTAVVAGPPARTTIVWSFESQDFDPTYGPCAVAGVNGEITLTRPPVGSGILFVYQLVAHGAYDTTDHRTFSIELHAYNNPAIISHQSASFAGPASSLAWDGTIIGHTTQNDVSVLNVFDIWITGHGISLDDRTKLHISRTARFA